MILDKKYYDAYGPIKGMLAWLKSFLITFVSYLFGTQKYLKEIDQPLFAWPILKDNSLKLCDSCRICETICPSDALVLEGELGQKPKKFQLLIDRCTQCTLCVTSCPAQILEMGHQHGLAFHAEQKRSQSLI